MEVHLEMAKKLAKYMFFQNKTDLDRLEKNGDAVLKITEGMSEKEIVEIMQEKINSLYGNYRIISSFLTFVRKHRNEAFLYLDDNMVEKTSDKAEQPFFISHSC